MKIDLSKFKIATFGQGRQRANSPSDVVSIRTCKNGTGHHDEQTQIRIGSDIMKRLRWVCGDRFSVYHNLETCEIVIVRNPDGEVGATGSGTKKEYTGKCATGVIKFKLRGSELTKTTSEKTMIFPHMITEDNMLLIDYKQEMKG